MTAAGPDPREGGEKTKAELKQMGENFRKSQWFDAKPAPEARLDYQKGQDYKDSTQDKDLGHGDKEQGVPELKGDRPDLPAPEAKGGGGEKLDRSAPDLPPPEKDDGAPDTDDGGDDGGGDGDGGDEDKAEAARSETGGETKGGGSRG